MLDVSKIKIVREPWVKQHQTRYYGSILIGQVVTVDDYAEVPESIIREQIVNGIWHGIYGDLHQPMMELQEYGILNARNYAQSQVLSSHCARVMRLLAVPEIKDETK